MSIEHIHDYGYDMAHEMKTVARMPQQRRGTSRPVVRGLAPRGHAPATHPRADPAVADACAAVPVDHVRWTPDAMVFALDGADYYSFPREPGGGRAAWPFDRPFHLILNVAVGGDWGGAEGIDDAALPQRMEIDWVRVWQAAD